MTCRYTPVDTAAARGRCAVAARWKVDYPISLDLSAARLLAAAAAASKHPARTPKPPSETAAHEVLTVVDSFVFFWDYVQDSFT